MPPPPETKHLTMAQLHERRARLIAWLRGVPKSDPQYAIGAWRLSELSAEIRRRGGRLDNPAWVDEALTVSWEHLETRIPPVVELLKSGLMRAKPLGCGLFGCVLRTIKPGIVLKLTNDISEARFVATVLQDDDLQHPGVVRYYDMVKLPLRYENRTVYALWREEAWDVGHVVPVWVKKGYKPRNRADRELDVFSDHLRDFQYYANKFATQRKRHSTWEVTAKVHRLANVAAKRVWVNDEGEVERDQVKGNPALALAIRLQMCRVYAELIAHGPRGQLVGRALADLMHEGLLLADVHLGNIGHAHRAGKKVIVITDPGITVPLFKKRNDLMEKVA